jgi:hypothetical protein
LNNEFRFVLLRHFPTTGSFALGFETYPNHFMLYDGSLMTLEDFKEYGCEAVIITEIDVVFALKDRFDEFKTEQHKKAGKGIK